MPTLAQVRDQYPQYADMSDEQLIKGLHQKYYSDLPFEDFSKRIGFQAPPQPAPETPAPDNRSFMQRGYDFNDKLMGQLGSAVVRPIAKGVSALPLMAMDAGVGARNLLTGGNYDLPSKMFNDSLDQYTLKPEGIGKAAELVSSSLVGGALGSPQAATQAPANFVRPAANATEETLRAGQQAGYVAPPAQANPTWGARLGEAAAGKTSVAQAAAAHNQEVTNTLARRAIGLSDNTPLNREALKAVRKEAGHVYKEIADSGEVTPDAAFIEEIKLLASASKSISDLVPRASSFDYSKGAGMVRGIEKLPASRLVAELKDLRFNAQRNLSPMAAQNPESAALGRAQRQAADSVESLLMRHLQSIGRDDLVNNFAASRTLIAKTHSIEKALNESTGNVIATSLGGQLKHGKPLSGELELAARFARTFPKATKEVNESLPFLSPWDFGWGGIGSVVAGNPLPAAYPFARMGLRKWLLSPQGQRLAAGQSVLGQVSPGAVMGAIPPAQQLTQ